MPVIRPIVDWPPLPTFPHGVFTDPPPPPPVAAPVAAPPAPTPPTSDQPPAADPWPTLPFGPDTVFNDEWSAWEWITAPGQYDLLKVDDRLTLYIGVDTGRVVGGWLTGCKPPPPSKPHA